MLSLERSQAVVNWLAQHGGIPFVAHARARRDEHGEAGPRRTRAPPAGHRTAVSVVKVLLNRGIAEPSA
jgi:hypothetical protein